MVVLAQAFVLFILNDGHGMGGVHGMEEQAMVEIVWMIQYMVDIV